MTGPVILDFRGRAMPRSPGIYRRVAEEINCEEAAVRAVIAVESATRGFLASGRPVILFERHTFSRRTRGTFDGKAPDVSNPKPGGYKGGEREYDRLAVAQSLNADAALESTSWGLCQIMGFNARLAGFDDARHMIDAFMDHEDNHIFGMLAFIVANQRMRRSIQNKDWSTFALLYNGPAYKKNSYDTKLAQAYNRARAKVKLDTPE